MEINSGIVYEHLLGKWCIITLKTGMKYVPMARISEKRAAIRDYIFRAKPEETFYFGVGLSLNSFAHKK